MAEESAGVDRFAARCGPGFVHHARTPHACGEREATGQRFAETNDVGDCFAPFTRKPSARSSKAGEDFIKDEQRSELIANAAQHW